MHQPTKSHLRLSSQTVTMVGQSWLSNQHHYPALVHWHWSGKFPMCTWFWWTKPLAPGVPEGLLRVSGPVCTCLHRMSLRAKFAFPSLSKCPIPSLGFKRRNGINFQTARRWKHHQPNVDTTSAAMHHHAGEQIAWQPILIHQKCIINSLVREVCNDCWIVIEHLL